LGELFVIRVAGNVVAPHELGSIEYAIEHLGANLVMVLGHSNCGAVKATYGAYPGHIDGNIGSLTEDIYPAVSKVVGTAAKPVDATAQAAQIEQCIVENLSDVAESLPKKSYLIEEYMRGKVEATGEYRKVKVVKAKYDLTTGVVSKLGSVSLEH
jgi:carbonic anhydrase